MKREPSLYERAVRKLGCQATSEARLRQYLQRFAPAAEVNSVLERLRQQGYINDRSHCETLLTRWGKCGYSDRQLQAKVRGKGLDGQLLAGLQSDGAVELLPEQQRALLAFRRRFGAGGQPDWGKAVPYLRRCGFSGTSIRHVMAQLDAEWE